MYITDLSQCTPRSALSEEMAQGRWQTIPYETCDEEPGKGVMLGAPSFVDAPEVRLRLNVSGWHSVYIGFWSFHYDYDQTGTRIRVKLDDDPAFVQINEPQPKMGDTHFGGVFLREAFFRTADLGGRDLILGKLGGPCGRKAYIAYVKLVPLGEEEVASLQKQRSTTDARILQCSIDGSSYMWGDEYKSREQLLELVEKFRYSNFEKLFWACSYGDQTNYPSQTGVFLGCEAQVPIPAVPVNNNSVACEEFGRQAWNELAAKGLIPQEVVGDYVHQMGLKFDAMFRLGILGYLPGQRKMAGKRRFVQAHPQFRQVTKHGAPVEQASYAYPEVRAFVLSIIQESMERFPFDGANLCFRRGPQFMRYEAPVMEDFREEYGEDGRGVGFDDPRMERIRCRYLTEFVRDTRRLLDAIGHKKRKRLELSVMVYRDTGRNRSCGFDVEAWLAEGLLDSILALDETGYSILPPEENRDRFSPELVDAARANNCKLICFSQLGYLGPAALARDLLWGHEAGCDGFGVWDIGDPVTNAFWRDVFSRVGDRAALESFVENPPQQRTVQLKTVGGCDVLELAVYSGG